MSLSYAVFRRGVARVSAISCLVATFSATTANAQQAAPLGGGLNAQPHAMAEYRGDLIVAGRFTRASARATGRVARWDGTAWHALGKGMDNWVRALVEYRGDLIAAGHFITADGETVNRIARWDGTRWHAMGEGMMGGERAQVLALAVYNDELIAGGFFDTAGGVPAKNIARWDGESWKPIGEGASRTVRALLVHEEELYIAGDFCTIDDTSACRVARWDGERWRPVGGGADSHVNALATYRGDVIAAGMFDCIGNRRIDRIARWDGRRWHPMGQGMFGATVEYPQGAVFDLIVHRDTLFAGGYFRANADPSVAYLAMWDGYEWEPVGDGVSDAVTTFASHKGQLYVGGRFRQTGHPRPADRRTISYVMSLHLPMLMPNVADVKPAPRIDDALASAIVRLGETLPPGASGVNRSQSGARSSGAASFTADEGSVTSDNVIDTTKDEVPTLPAPMFQAVLVAGSQSHRYAWLAGLNDYNEAVGHASVDRFADDATRSLFWSEAGVALAAARGWAESAATAINDDGIVTGWARYDAGSTFGYLWDHANTIVALADMSHPVDIDRAGRVLGVTHAGDAAVWEGDTAIELPLLPGGHRFIPAAMNDHQWIVGSGRSERTGDMHAFAYADGQYIDLGLSLGWDGASSAVAVSNSGLVLGTLHVREDAAAGAMRMVIWNIAAEAAQMSKVIDPPAGYSQIVGMDINDNGDVVGHFGWPRAPFLYTGGVLHNLHDLVEPSDAAFVTATRINNNGWITADGHDGCCAYMLIPIKHRRGDVANSGDVGIADVLVLFDSWGACPASGACAADLNDDGHVDALDLLQLLDAWSSGGTAMPAQARGR